MRNLFALRKIIAAHNTPHMMLRCLNGILGTGTGTWPVSIYMNREIRERARILLIGIGNPARRDEALGWRYAERIKQAGVPDLDIEFRYQLQVEDAVLISKYDRVLFADATHTRLPAGFDCFSCVPAQHYGYPSRQQTAESLLYLSRELYDHVPLAWAIRLSGRSWGIGTGLSDAAAHHLERAVADFMDRLRPSLLSPEDPVPVGCADPVRRSGCRRHSHC